MERLVVGRVTRPHGLAGGLFLEVETDRAEEVFVPGRVLGVEGAEPGLASTLTVEEARPHGRGWMLRVAEVRDRALAEEYAGSYLTLPREELPEPGRGEYFLHELVGLEVVDEELGAVGEVADVYEAPAGVLLAVWVEGRERLIPFRRETVRQVEVAAGRLTVRLPPGLLEL